MVIKFDLKWMGGDVSVMREREAHSLGLLWLQFANRVRVLYGPGKRNLHILGVAKAVLGSNRKL